VFIRQVPSHLYTQECNLVAVTKDNSPIVIIPLLVHSTKYHQEETPTVPKYKRKYKAVASEPMCKHVNYKIPFSCVSVAFSTSISLVPYVSGVSVPSLLVLLAQSFPLVNFFFFSSFQYTSSVSHLSCPFSCLLPKESPLVVQGSGSGKKNNR
jgi:hypothetical protein